MVDAITLMYNEYMDQIRWSVDFAYCIGLIATDGCLYSDGRHICFTSKDIELVTLFRKILMIENKIGATFSGATGKKTYRIQFGNKKIFDFLVSLGISPNKSKTINKIDIPKSYFFDFLRGEFDGDGSFYFYKDKRFNSFVYYLSFNSASENHILWLRSEIQEYLGVRGHISKAKTSSVYSLRYGKKEGLQIINKMYYSSEVPCLKRKRQKIENARVVKLVDTQP